MGKKLIKTGKGVINNTSRCSLVYNRDNVAACITWVCWSFWDWSYGSDCISIRQDLHLSSRASYNTNNTTNTELYCASLIVLYVSYSYSYAVTSEAISG